MLFHAWLNAANETGFANPIDGRSADSTVRCDGLGKARRGTVRFRAQAPQRTLGRDGERTAVVTKGALPKVLAVCTTVVRGGKVVPLDSAKERIGKQFEDFSARGLSRPWCAHQEAGRRGADRQVARVRHGFLGFSCSSIH